MSRIPHYNHTVHHVTAPPMPGHFDRQEIYDIRDGPPMHAQQPSNPVASHSAMGELLNNYDDDPAVHTPSTPSNRGAMSISSLLNNEDPAPSSALPATSKSMPISAVRSHDHIPASSALSQPQPQQTTTSGSKKRRKSSRPTANASDRDEDYYPSKAAKRRRGPTAGPTSPHTSRMHHAVVDPDETESSSGGSAIELRRARHKRDSPRAPSPLSDISSVGENDDEAQILVEKAAYLESVRRRLADISQLAAEARNHYRAEYQIGQLKRYDDTTTRGRDQARNFFRDEAMALVLCEEEDKERERTRKLKQAQKKRKSGDKDEQVDGELAALEDEEGSAENLHGDAETYVKAELADDASAMEAVSKKARKGKGKAKKDSAEDEAAVKPKKGKGKGKKVKDEEGEDEGAQTKKKGKRKTKGITAAADDDDDEDDDGTAAAPTLKIMLTSKSKKSHKSKQQQVAQAHAAAEKAVAAEKVAAEKAAAAAEAAKNVMPTPREIKMYAKSYNTMYDAIWRDIARKDIPKVARIVSTSVTIKQANARKTAQLAVKESRRWQFRTNKNVKDLQGKARRAMREMLVYWKRNEREERDSRKKAEKQALDRAKKEEEQREARRQARKLNFLITQTELYSHFIGRKIKTDEIEAGSFGDGVATDESEAQIQKSASAEERANRSEEEHELVKDAQKRNISELDFDQDDDADLHHAALQNAHSAVVSAQNRAKTFDNRSSDVDAETGEMNFQNPTTLGEIEISQPNLLSCTLKGYQLKGLNWLVNLYEQGINGILADEMGLGKTVQSISVMAYLAQTHNIWGPFLVIAPASTLHNWQQEITKFVPDFKALPYWGNAKDRKVLRKFWDRKQLTYTKDAPFHVLITSYQLIVADAQYFQRIKWQYMILDEAQAIKSSSSTRWKSLLGFQCRNRLLLTGTPIQNSMQELWALLHFIMPTLFDSHDEFSEWFSKDIESHATSNTQLNEEQLKRLHMILKPFMLRRVKKHVQSELGDKIEIDVYCDLTYRQRAMYRALKAQINLIDIMEQADSDDANQNLMNLVMQFRKVCNHPDLFERSDTKSPLSLARFSKTGSFLREGNTLDVLYNTHNFIEYVVPKLVYREGMMNVPGEKSNAGFRSRYLDHLLNIWEANYIHDNEDHSNAFSWLKFVDQSANDISRAFHEDIVTRTILEQYTTSRRGSLYFSDEEKKNYTPSSSLFLVTANSDQMQLCDMTNEGITENLKAVSTSYFRARNLHKLDPMADPVAVAPPIEALCLDPGFVTMQYDILFSLRFRDIIFGPTQQVEQRLIENHVPPYRYPLAGLLPEPSSECAGYSPIRVPPMSKFVTDSGKLLKLDSLLAELKANDHRVLIYFQMTRMMDLMEEYLAYRQYKYVRLDGSSRLSDRRDLVNDWQTKPDLFVFLLSTRAGGLGINLTAADTVIFYDSDWNPTMDSQAMDRAHRLGQTKQVTVYRLLVRGTIEERMRDRAKQKMHVQQVVMEGGAQGEAASATGGVDFQKPTREVAFWLLE